MNACFQFPGVSDDSYILYSKLMRFGRYSDKCEKNHFIALATFRLLYTDRNDHF